MDLKQLEICLVILAVGLSDLCATLSCFDCASTGISCNEGLCVNEFCTVTILDNISNGERIYSKSCSPSGPPNRDPTNGCVQITAALSVTTICACNTADYCNGSGTSGQLLSTTTEQQTKSTRTAPTTKTTPTARTTRTIATNVLQPSTLTECVQCVSPDCDRAPPADLGACYGELCAATVTIDLTTSERRVTKGCTTSANAAVLDLAPSKRNHGCLKSAERDAETWQCVCDFNRCTDNVPLRNLIQTNTKSIWATTAAPQKVGLVQMEPEDVDDGKGNFDKRYRDNAATSLLSNVFVLFFCLYIVHFVSFLC